MGELAERFLPFLSWLRTYRAADLRADINGDGVVNIKDLALLGSNYGRSGCQTW